MPYCPNCKETFRDGFSHCSDCGAPLIADDMPDDFMESSMLPLSEFVSLTDTWGWTQTSIIYSLLQSCGIRVETFGCSSPAELMTGTTGLRAILVDSRDIEAAREILAAGPDSFLPPDEL